MRAKPTVAILREGTEGLSMANYASKVSDQLPESSVTFAPTPRAERAAIESAQVVTGITIDPNLLAHAKQLKMFACVFSGTDHLPLEALAEREVTVTNAGGIHAPGIAEQVLGAILKFSRNLLHAREQQRRGTWQHYQPGELKGSTVTVVGMGNVGSAVVQRLQGFEVDTIAVRHTPTKGGATDEVVGYDRLHEALSVTDYLVLACPLTDITERLLGPAEFATLPPSAVVVNVARGRIINTDALVSALRTESIRGAAVDVTDPEPLPDDHPLWRIDSCLITPHVGGHTPHHWERLAKLLASNVAALDGDGTLQNVVRS